MPYIGKQPATISAVAVDTTTGTFSGNVTAGGTLGVGGVLTANAGIKIDNFTIDGTEIDLSSGMITLDSADDITLDAANNAIRFKSSGTEVGQVSLASSDLSIISSVSDKDIIFKGSDGGSTITALTLDMSEAGAATFNDKITAVGTSVFTNLDISGDVDIDGTLEADAMTLNGTAITTVATLSTGISNGNLPVFTSGVADDDFLRVNSTSIEGRSASEVLSDIGASPVAGSSSIVTTGALDAGSITSGFGNIDTGSSTITTTGLGTFGTLAVNGATTITTADNTAQLELVSTDADSGIGPHQVFYRNSASPADGDLLCELDFRGRNDNSQDVDYATINIKATDVTDGTEDGQFILQTKQAGSTVDRMNLSSAETVFNDDSKDIDFRVESDGNANMLVVDASLNAVSIGGGASTSYQLKVAKSDGSVQQLLSAAANFNSTIAFGDPDLNDAGEIIYAHNGDSMRFHTNDTEAARITSSQALAVGTTDESSGAKFIVGSTDDDKRAFIQGSNQYRLGLKNGSNNHVWLGSGGADNFRVSNSSGSTLLELTSGGVLSTSGGGLGKVLQVVEGTTTSTTTTSSNSFVTAQSVNITPSSTSSKVFITCSMSYNLGGTNTTGIFEFELRRDSSGIASTTANRSSGSIKRNASEFVKLDTPNTTSQVTYSINIKRSSGSDSLNYSEGGERSTIIAMEIAG